MNTVSKGEMKMGEIVIAQIYVNGVTAVASRLKKIPKGIIGATIHVTFGSDWDGLAKTAVFQGAVTKDVLVEDKAITIPVECVDQPGRRLRVGFYGVSEDELVIPTIWTDLGMIQDAADPSGDTSTDPTLPVWAQLHELVDNRYYTPAVEQTDETTMTVSFTASKETMDDVPDVSITLPRGMQGEKGEDGYTPQKGIDYFDGYTPVKNVDYFDGEQGIPGEKGEKGDKGDKGDTGESPTLSVTMERVDYTNNSIMPGKTGIAILATVNNGTGSNKYSVGNVYDGENGTNGKDGKDGTPCAHRWDGYNLIITSASGTTMTNLRGEKGETGSQGAQGNKGDTGADGKSAYQIALDNGFKGTEAEWLESLKGEGGSVVVDSELSATSENPVQNKVITGVINEFGTTFEQTMQAIAPRLNPVVATADNGKFLQAVNGAWVAVDATSQVTAIVNAVLEEALGGEY